jgi:nicotinamidase/pyrazinamidase
MQNDFLPGGALGIPDGDEILPQINRLTETFVERGLPVVFSRDWHPPGHCSFFQQGGVWPPHCVQNSDGAAFAATLRMPAEPTIISKATREDTEVYSAFESTGLDRLLTARGVTRLYVVGLATDYCVVATVRDARRLGYDVVVPAIAVRAVDVHPDDGAMALEEMRKFGADVVPGDV